MTATHIVIATTPAYASPDGRYIDDIRKGTLLTGYFEGEWYRIKTANGEPKNHWAIAAPAVREYEPAPPDQTPTKVIHEAGFAFHYDADGIASLTVIETYTDGTTRIREFYPNAG